MSQFTYEYTDRTDKLETYEWDNVWWEHARTTGVPRVLYIGDSISCATRHAATKAAEESIFFDGYGTSKAVDNPYFADAVRSFAAQQGQRQVILFNNGLHGFHLEDSSEYAAHYEELLKFLLAEFPQTPLYILLTTHVANQDRDARVILRNEAVLKIAKKYDLPVVDFYKITLENAHLLSADGVHLTEEGYRLLAEKLVETVRNVIE
ncbi:MAG: SGNH/GDSL hydrolase family protein [Clostridia bacterium]|nr:SGNH/GDSL hydrolase family protein [Clostridia bacterium]